MGGGQQFIRVCGMTHVRTSPYYPQSNGKLERWHRSVKAECIRPGTPLSLADAIRLVKRYVAHYNNVRSHSAIGYVTPQEKLAGREHQIFAARDRKLEEARARRAARRREVSRARGTLAEGQLQCPSGGELPRSGTCPSRPQVRRSPNLWPAGGTIQAETRPAHVHSCETRTHSVNSSISCLRPISRRRTKPRKVATAS